MTPVRIGLAGYGRGGRFFHAPLIGLAPECTLAAVLTRSPQRRIELADDFPGLPVAGTLGELAVAGIDAVVISTPLDTHEALVREAIALGLPAVCDKPFTPDAASARALVDEAERSGVPLAVYQNRRWDADFLTVRALVESGALGEVTAFESRMEQHPPAGGFSATGDVSVIYKKRKSGQGDAGSSRGGEENIWLRLRDVPWRQRRRKRRAGGIDEVEDERLARS